MEKIFNTNFFFTSCAAFARSIGGYLCTQDCSGHEEGYKWAERKGIDSVDDCRGNSQSFIKGCEAYVEENSSDEGDNESDGDQDE